MPYSINMDHAPQDVVEVLEVLLENARVGHITGIAFACTMYKSRYITNVVGHCQTNPTFALGMLATLSGELVQMASRTDPGETR